jgi:hypothetical protein
MHHVTEYITASRRRFMLLGRHDLRGYEWKVIIDPTRKCDDPGLFYGRLFRMIDLSLDRDEISTWPDGIVFEHQVAGPFAFAEDAAHAEHDGTLSS